jgi:hypothetical protein
MLQIELLVNSVQDGMFTLTNCTDEDVPLKTTLTTLYARDAHRVGDGWESSPPRDVQSVSLTVETAEIFRKKIDCIPRGFSAGVRLSGTGQEAVQKRLADKGRDTQVFLGADVTSP